MLVIYSWGMIIFLGLMAVACVGGPYSTPYSEPKWFWAFLGSFVLWAACAIGFAVTLFA